MITAVITYETVKRVKGGLIALSQITSKEKQELLKLLEKGYKDMADINIEIAEEGISADNEALSAAEEKLEN